MSDRTYFQFTVHACPDGRVDALAAAIAAHVVPDLCWTETTDTAACDSLAARLRHLPAELFIEEAGCGIADEVNTDALVAAAPEATWEFWEDPAYEWLGRWYGYDPVCGEVFGDCDSNGRQVVGCDQATAALNHPDTPGLSPDDLLGRIFPQTTFPPRAPGRTAP